MGARRRYRRGQAGLREPFARCAHQAAGLAQLLVRVARHLQLDVDVAVKFLAPAYADAAVQSIYAGTNEIMKRIIARNLGLDC
ncbi:hypothetical protein B4Q13_16505 [Lacticaseibacillus rhamnosus]